MPEARADVGLRRAGPLLAAAGGVLYAVGYLGFGVWPCLLVFLCPLWRALDGARGPVDAAVLGVVFGFAGYALGFSWLWRLVEVFLAGDLGVGAAAWVAYGAWFALGFGVYAALVYGLRRRGRSLAFAGIAPLVLVEWTQPLLFPVYAGAGLAAMPAWIQIADLGGPLLLTVLVGLANVVACETLAWRAGRRGRPDGVWLAALAATLLDLGYGAIRVARIDTRAGAAPALRVGIVQANLGLLEKRTQAEVTHARHVAQTRELLADGDVELVVWPETAYVRGLRGPLPISGLPIRGDLGPPLLFGGSAVLEVDGRKRTANAAFLVGADGMIRDAYEKNLLVPLAEYVPLATLLPGLTRWLPHAQEFRAATDTPPLRLGAWRIATPICYEAIRPEFVRRMVARAEPHVLVTLANDAWFGDSAEPWMHLALARLRAVEHRRYLVRATNSGISAVVDPAGRIVARTGVLARENLRAVVRPLDGTTVYGRLGDWPGWVALALVGGGLVAGRTPRPSVAPQASAERAVG